MEPEFVVGDMVSQIGYPGKWVVMGCRSSTETYFVCEIEDGKRYENVIQLEPELNRSLVKVGKWSFGQNCEVDDDDA